MGVRDELDADFAEWAAGRPRDQVLALQRWQGNTFTYLQVQQRLRGAGAPRNERFDSMVEAIGAAVNAGRVRRPVEVWRGLQSCQDSLEVDGADLPGLVGQVLRQPGFFSTSTEEAIVRESFLDPWGRGGAVLMRLEVPAGARAAWLPPVSQPSLRDECELLLPPSRRILIREVTFEGDLPIVGGEVA